MNNYKVAVFDLDGTILDTLEDLTISMNAGLAANGQPTHSREEMRMFVGRGIPMAVKRALAPNDDPELAEKVLADFTEHYRVHCADHTFPNPGICEVLSALNEVGYYLAVVSNKADYAVQDLCATRFPAVFDAVVGIQEGVARKPAPDAANKALAIIAEKTGQAVDELAKSSVFIGDSDVDIQTARNAGLDEILVSWGFRGRAFLEEHGAKRIVDEPMELLSLLLPDR